MDQSVKQHATLEMQAMMEACKKLATPGAPHNILTSRAGNWNAKNRHWTDLNKPPVKSLGTCERKMILGGRYLLEKFKGDMMGSPFEGLGIMAYDNHAKKYKSIWIDTMSTGIHAFEGSGSPDGKTITMEGRMDDAVRGPVTLQLVTTIKDDKTETFEMNMTGKDGKAEKCEMTYARK